MTSIKDSKKIKSGNKTYFIPDENQSEDYTRLKFEMQNKFNLNLKSRDEIIKVLISYLTQGDYINFSVQKLNLSILRTDIKSFFPSVSKHILYQKLNNSNILNNDSLNILKEFIFTSKVEGIPLGFQFSNHLAEFFLEDFDNDIKLFFQPIMYFRYVDDILIINYDDSKDRKTREKNENEMKDLISRLLSKYELKINSKKTEVSFLNQSNLKKDIDFNYLGYRFYTRQEKLYISISKEKYLKILNKIKNDFYKYKKNKSSNKAFWTLYYRLVNILFGITSYNKNGKKFKFGMGYNYRYINDQTMIKELVYEIKKLVFSCRLNSYKTNTLLSIIKYDQSPLEIINKRFNYIKLTGNQMKLIKKRLNANNIPIDKNFSKRIFYLIY
ncbi:RNA-directed DNA polymerase [Evansella cellulosilytica]|uniref:Reverse transcriptase domain-containing protein n=1 Tax=Evansella cellulosilytica (strain ATCC 21833 / DSM 2522 / FERM P-1141 / JCM 9156 / N-4) TaxID=649639 RepID=E6TR45_EVAC2|nr:RNA-directed DNA polymerase [Evansella cellulosilytica]ADU29421.1 hypothetical protein Bcell_1155 [Evansella cellulosilytica DSM 2522]